jgi:hypothetical protein
MNILLLCQFQATVFPESYVAQTIPTSRIYKKFTSNISNYPVCAADVSTKRAELKTSVKNFFTMENMEKHGERQKQKKIFVFLDFSWLFSMFSVLNRFFQNNLLWGRNFKNQGLENTEEFPN